MKKVNFREVTLLGGAKIKNNEVQLALPGSGMKFGFEGKQLEIELYKLNNPEKEYPWVEIIIEYKDKKKNITRKIMYHKRIWIINRKNKVKAFIRIIKRTEVKFGEIYIKSIAGSGTIEKEAYKNFRVEFIGDSITCGYGAEWYSIFQLFKTRSSNVIKSYAFHFAQKIEAEYRIVAYSGIGVWKSHEGVGDLLIENFYQKYHNSFQCQNLIVINIGTNDTKFINGMEEQEKFKEAYYHFLEQVRCFHPESKIICTIGPMRLELAKLIEQVCVEFCDKKCDAYVFFYCFHKIDLFREGIGVGKHPLSITQKRMAKELYEFCVKNHVMEEVC